MEGKSRLNTQIQSTLIGYPQSTLIGKQFWDFLGGKGAYSELLDCFERAGIELRPEIDEYFSKMRYF